MLQCCCMARPAPVRATHWRCVSCEAARSRDSWRLHVVWAAAAAYAAFGPAQDMLLNACISEIPSVCSASCDPGDALVPLLSSDERSTGHDERKACQLPAQRRPFGARQLVGNSSERASLCRVQEASNPGAQELFREQCMPSWIICQWCQRTDTSSLPASPVRLARHRAEGVLKMCSALA